MRDQIITAAIIATLIFVIHFYRKPDGGPVVDGNVVIAPSYGKVVDITRDGDRVHIIVFLSPKDVHMQYVPVSGCLRRSEYDRTGRFHLAYKVGKSRFNEKRIHDIETIHGTVTVMQIAGFLTRRVESYLPPVGEMLQAGRPLGFIHLGSRCDLLLPVAGLTLMIKKGDRLHGGHQTVGVYA